jgi:hypothetical protein
MVTIDCPWCEAPVSLERADLVRCDGCMVQVEISPETGSAVGSEVALAA